MLYALNVIEEKIPAVPGATGFCPGCSGALIAKCGSINVWHWAHVQKDCDWDSKPETKWHLEWKQLFPAEWCEVKVNNHRADVQLPNKHVIEFQNSSISPEDIKNRNGNASNGITWVINGELFFENWWIENDKKSHQTFGWKWPRKSYIGFGPFFMDFTDNNLIFHVKKLYENGYGWGNSIRLFEPRRVPGFLFEQFSSVDRHFFLSQCWIHQQQKENT